MLFTELTIKFSLGMKNFMSLRQIKFLKVWNLEISNGHFEYILASFRHFCESKLNTKNEQKDAYGFK